MAWLPLANVAHHKLSSCLSAFGIGIGVCMMITLTGLTRGSLYEVADRWESVDAELIVYPKLRQDVSMLTGAGINDRFSQVLPEQTNGEVTEATPVFLWRMKLAGQDQTVAGVSNADLHVVAGRVEPDSGRAKFKPHQDWQSFRAGLVEKQQAAWVAQHGRSEGFVFDPKPDELLAGGWMELIIDSRLARAGGYDAGDEVTAAGHRWQIVGIIPSGGLARVYMPRQTAQLLFAGGAPRSTVMFISLAESANMSDTQQQIAQLTDQEVKPLSSYRVLLVDKFSVMFLYIHVVNILAMGIAFLFIMITLYTMVLQRTRDIAILKSSGASSGYILRQVMVEAMLLTAAGAIAGIAMSFAAAWAIEQYKPLLTVTITPEWIGLGLICAMLGAIVSALYPAWRATRVDMLSALTYE